MVTCVLLKVARMLQCRRDVFRVLGLDDFLRVWILAEQVGGGWHNGRNRFSRREQLQPLEPEPFPFGMLGFRRRSRSGIGLDFFFFFRRGRFYLFFGHNEIQFGELVDAGLGVRVALHADGFARAFARAGVGLRALAAHGQAAHVADAAVALDALQALEVHAEFAAQVAFDDVLAFLDRVNDLGELLPRSDPSREWTGQCSRVRESPSR